MYKKVIAGIALVGFASAKSAFAVCPICSFAVGAGLVVTRLVGIDDSITGVWIGALIMSMSLWTVNWLIKRNWNFRYSKTIVSLGFVIITILPLYYMDIFGHPLNRLWGMDKLILGTVIGGVVFTWMAFWYIKIKANNGGHAIFPFQKVVMPLGALTILSIFFYLVTM